MKGDSGVSARGGSFLQVLLVKTVIQLHLMAWMWCVTGLWLFVPRAFLVFLMSRFSADFPMNDRYNWYIIIFLLLWNRWTRIPMLM